MSEKTWSDETAREILLSIPHRIPKGMLKNVSSIFHFKINGTPGGNFTLIAKDEEATAQEGLTGEPNCIITAEEQIFVEVYRQEANAVLAIMTGKIKISNKAEAIKMAQLFGWV